VTQIEGKYRAWNAAKGGITLVLDLGGNRQQRFYLAPDLNNAHLWEWLDGRVRPPARADADKAAPPGDGYVSKSGPKPGAAKPGGAKPGG
jgi:hypothetical protein